MERVENECRKRTELILESNESRRRIDDLVKLAEAIRNQFTSKEKSSIRWNEVADSINQSNLNVFVDEKEIRQKLFELQKILPEWLQIVSLPNKVTILKQLTKMTSFDIRERIKLVCSN